MRANFPRRTASLTLSLPPYPPFRLLNPTRPRFVRATPRFLLVATLLPALNSARFYSARRRSAREEESKIYAKSMREGVLRNRYFVTGEITTCVIRGLAVSSEGFLCHFYLVFISCFRILSNFAEFYQRKPCNETSETESLVLLL